MTGPPNAERHPGKGGALSGGGDLSSTLTIPRGVCEPARLRSPYGWGDDDRMDAAAVHEAGHVVARLALGLSFRYVTIRRRGGLPGEGNTAVHARRFANFGEQYAGAVATAAGPEAERRFLAEEHGEEEADWLLGFLGGTRGDDEALSRHDASMRQHLREQAGRYLSDFWPAVLALAERMLTDPRTLTRAEARQIVATLPCWPEYRR